MPSRENEDTITPEKPVLKPLLDDYKDHSPGKVEDVIRRTVSVTSQD